MIYLQNVNSFRSDRPEFSAEEWKRPAPIPVTEALETNVFLLPADYATNR